VFYIGSSDPTAEELFGKVLPARSHYTTIKDAFYAVCSKML
jgi:hypothetical protein